MCKKSTPLPPSSVICPHCDRARVELYATCGIGVRSECCACSTEIPETELMLLFDCGHSFHVACVADSFEKGRRLCPATTGCQLDVTVPLQHD
jgi:hypothetical protein